MRSVLPQKQTIKRHFLIVFPGSGHDSFPGDAGGLGTAGPAAKHCRGRGVRDRTRRERQSATVRRHSLRGGHLRGRAPRNHHSPSHSGNGSWPPRWKHRSHLHAAASGEPAIMHTSEQYELCPYTTIPKSSKRARNKSKAPLILEDLDQGGSFSDMIYGSLVYMPHRCNRSRALTRSGILSFWRFLVC